MHHDPKKSRVEYDLNGNIILRGEHEDFPDSPPSGEQIIERVSRLQMIRPEPSDGIIQAGNAWTIIEETCIEQLDGNREAGMIPIVHRRMKPSLIGTFAKDTKALISSTMSESWNQYCETAEDAGQGMGDIVQAVHALPRRSRASMLRFWKTAEKPCVEFVPETVRTPKSKTVLFIFDAVRFGGTFALIFATLFIGINYQSFWQIAKGYLALNVDTQNEQALEELVRPGAGLRAMAAGFGHADSQRYEAGSMLAYLPNAGPFENRLVISKIGKNVPIIMPSMESLMKEDWKGFETDVQKALHEGVVHYPGSARPGQPGNFFLTGHSSYYPWDDGKYKDVFARLHELNIGDTYSVYYGGDMHLYRVINKKEVRPSDVSVLDQPVDKRLSTLMTCTPVGTTLRRLILQAEEIDPVSGVALEVGQRTKKVANGDSKAVKLEALPI